LLTQLDVGIKKTRPKALDESGRPHNRGEAGPQSDHWGRWAVQPENGGMAIAKPAKDCTFITI